MYTELLTCQPRMLRRNTSITKATYIRRYIMSYSYTYDCFGRPALNCRSSHLQATRLGVAGGGACDLDLLLVGYLLPSLVGSVDL